MLSFLQDMLQAMGPVQYIACAVAIVAFGMLWWLYRAPADMRAAKPEQEAKVEPLADPTTTHAPPAGNEPLAPASAEGDSAISPAAPFKVYTPPDDDASGNP